MTLLLLTASLWLGAAQEPDRNEPVDIGVVDRGEAPPGAATQIARETGFAHLTMAAGIVTSLCLFAAATVVSLLIVELSAVALMGPALRTSPRTAGMTPAQRTAFATAVPISTGLFVFMFSFPATASLLLPGCAILESVTFGIGAVAMNRQHRSRALLAWLLSELPHALLLGSAVMLGLVTTALVFVLGRSGSMATMTWEPFEGDLATLMFAATVGGLVACPAMLLAEGLGVVMRAGAFAGLRLIPEFPAATDGE